MENVFPSPIVLSNLIFQHCKITRTRAKGIAIFKSLRKLADRLITRSRSKDKLKHAMTCALFNQGFISESFIQEDTAGRVLFWLVYRPPEQAQSIS